VCVYSCTIYVHICAHPPTNPHICIHTHTWSCRYMTSVASPPALSSQCVCVCVCVCGYTCTIHELICTHPPTHMYTHAHLELLICDIFSLAFVIALPVKCNLPAMAYTYIFCVFMHIYEPAYKYMNIFGCRYRYMYIHTHTHTHVSLSMTCHVRAIAYTYTFLSLHIFVCLHMYMNIPVCRYRYIYTHIYTHTHIPSQWNATCISYTHIHIYNVH